MNSCQAIIFDYDGTLVDLSATPLHMDSLRTAARACLAEFGADIELRPFYRCIDAALRQLSQRSLASTVAAHKRLIDIIKPYEEEFSNCATAKPFARQVIQTIVSRVRIGIVSNNLASWIRPTLQRLNIIRPDDPIPIVGFESTQQHKPNADGLCQVADSLGLTKGDRALYVGDHCDDLEACLRFNALGGPRMCPVMVKSGKCPWDQIVSHHYFEQRMAISDLSELARFLRTTGPASCPDVVVSAIDH